MVRSEYVALFFRLINFGALIALIWYLYATRYRKQLVAQISQQEAFWRNIRANIVRLKEQKQQLIQDVKQQEDYAQQLLSYIHIWQQAVQAYTIKQKNEQQLYQEKAKKRSEQQQQYHVIQEVAQTTTLLVLQDLTQELQEQYKGDAGSAYIDAALHKEGNSHG